MRYHNITKDDMLNGDGLRVVLWVAGCEHHCPGCQNPITWDPNGGVKFTDEAKQEIYTELDKDYIDGITFSGGDPLYPTNIFGVIALALEIKKKYPNKTQWLYTGYTLEQIRDKFDMIETIYDVEPFDMFDVIITGNFNRSQREADLAAGIRSLWRGDSSQGFHKKISDGGSYTFAKMDMIDRRFEKENLAAAHTKECGCPDD